MNNGEPSGRGDVDNGQDENLNNREMLVYLASSYAKEGIENPVGTSDFVRAVIDMYAVGFAFNTVCHTAFPALILHLRQLLADFKAHLEENPSLQHFRRSMALSNLTATLGHRTSYLQDLDSLFGEALPDVTDAALEESLERARLHQEIRDLVEEAAIGYHARSCAGYTWLESPIPVAFDLVAAGHVATVCPIQETRRSIWPGSAGTGPTCG